MGYNYRAAIQFLLNFAEDNHLNIRKNFLDEELKKKFKVNFIDDKCKNCRYNHYDEDYQIIFCINSNFCNNNKLYTDEVFDFDF